ncbi:pyridoxamine 5'-phosphate oxidase family protein [Paenibacillus motobuensis]|uniref:pyridoxamine 5'-phosphate oxidase family protein n=1 Tax=Paenibacillus TaxID=44249 RepID=UPI00203A9C0B|nr:MULTISPECIES: pyridoxamine 5'-phosphate oxidase family protein [Paenibacillus]MCM3040488.1 pyridoxamine 5'-phosphate oxidase family protein [Paenibacillus lutimineralis]MCM3647592.1 pyridoxamine 5'-phosphate oxidase family protein [Paenibacillus motobuensis]
MSELVTQLSEPLFNAFQSEMFVLLSTVDVETGGPTSSAISWIYALNPSTLRFAVDHRSRLVNNMKTHPRVTVTLFGVETIYAINGVAEVAQDPLEGVPFKMCCFDMKIDAVRNALFYGAQLASAPTYSKVYDQRAMEKLDNQVFSAMKKA